MTQAQEVTDVVGTRDHGGTMGEAERRPGAGAGGVPPEGEGVGQAGGYREKSEAKTEGTRIGQIRQMLGNRWELPDEELEDLNRLLARLRVMETANSGVREARAELAVLLMTVVRGAGNYVRRRGVFRNRDLTRTQVTTVIDDAILPAARMLMPLLDKLDPPRVANGSREPVQSNDGSAVEQQHQNEVVDDVAAVEELVRSAAIER